MKAIIFAVTICLLVSLVSCSNEVSYCDYVKNLCGFSTFESTVVSVEDSHGGFLGDGALTVEFDCSENSDDLLPQLSSWNALPLSENLQLIMYGGTKDGITYGYLLAEKYGIPDVQNGYYYFVDKHDASTISSSDQDLFNRYSFNFSLVIFDSDSEHLYLLEFDT